MRAAPYKIAASLVASCSNRFNNGMTDHLISTRIQQIPGMRLSGTVSVARFRRLNALIETTPSADFLVPAAFSGDESRASRYGGNWHTKRNVPGLKRRIRGPRV